MMAFFFSFYTLFHQFLRSVVSGGGSVAETTKERKDRRQGGRKEGRMEDGKERQKKGT